MLVHLYAECQWGGPDLCSDTMGTQQWQGGSTLGPVGRNKPCWCGSSKKRKLCHPNYVQKGVLDPAYSQQVRERALAMRLCLHPKASSSSCSGWKSRAHTIQERVLRQLARNGKVYRMSTENPDRVVTPTLIGVRKASVFNGFCQKHDNELFAPLEKEPWQASRLQVALLGYRAISYEYVAKLSVGWMLDELLGNEVDHSTDNLVAFRHGTGLAEKELRRIIQNYEQALLSSNVEPLSYYIVEIADTPEVICSAAAQTTHDFRGFQVDSLADTSREPSWHTISILPTDKGGAIVIAWLEDNRGLNESVTRTLDKFGDAEVVHAAIRYAFEFSENTFFKPDWWDQLDTYTQQQFIRRFSHGLPPTFGHAPESLMEDGLRVVRWQVTNRELCVSSGKEFDLSA